MILLRPWFLLCLPLIIAIAIYLWRKPGTNQDWYKLCDRALLTFFQQGQTDNSWRLTWGAMMLSLLLMNLALCGPAWEKKEVKMASIQEPVIIVMDLSTQMLLDDVSPSRLERTKMLLHDLLAKFPEKQWGFLVFSNMAYVVTPITTDTQNILNFLPVISPQILPSGGYQIESALQKAKQLLKQSRYESGQFLILSSKLPERKDYKLPQFINMAWVNIAPNTHEIIKTDYPQFNIRQTEAILAWFDKVHLYSHKLQSSTDRLMQYHDEGRWFLALALVPLVLVFRKGWLIRLWG